MALTQKYDRFYLSSAEMLELDIDDFYADVDAQLVSDYPISLLALHATSAQREELYNTLLD